jgi:hypothetical protein
MAWRSKQTGSPTTQASDAYLKPAHAAITQVVARHAVDPERYNDHAHPAAPLASC